MRLVTEKIRMLDATNILTFGRAPLVEDVLLLLAENPPDNLNIRVIDGHVNGPGKSLIKTLIQYPIQCTYGLLNCLANELDHTHLVLLGASAVLADRSLIVPRGSSNIIYLSRSLNVPTVVIVEPSQFIDKNYEENMKDASMEHVKAGDYEIVYTSE